MSEGIVFNNSSVIKVSNTKIAGYDTGIKATDSEDITLDSILIISKEVLTLYGPEFRYVFDVVHASKDKSAVIALATIQAEPQPDKAVNAWVTLIKQFPKELGNFAASTLPKVLSATTYALIKAKLSEYGILLP